MPCSSAILGGVFEISASGNRDQDPLGAARFAPVETINQRTRVYLQAVREPKKTLQTRVALSSLYRTNEVTVKADPLSEFHLAPAKFQAPGPHAIAEFRLCWITLDGPAHPYSPDSATSLMVVSLTLVNW